MSTLYWGKDRFGSLVVVKDKAALLHASAETAPVQAQANAGHQHNN